jgi:hypothetical protein
MSIEKLGDFLNRGSKDDSLKRVQLAFQLQKEISQLTPDPFKVVVKKTKIIITCSNSSQASFLKIKKGEINLIISRYCSNTTTINFKLG